jgi:aspartokinase/homoserine dehydrogenase 1
MTLPRKSLPASVGAQRDRQLDTFGDPTVEQTRKFASDVAPMRGCEDNFETLFASAEPMGGRGSHAPGLAARANEHVSEHVHRYRAHHASTGASDKKRIRVLKFGGTSVGDAASIERTVEIVRAATREISSVVVVSAMNGVTNKLVEAVSEAGAGNRERVSLIFKELRKRHDTAASELIHAAGERNRISDMMLELFREGERACQSTNGAEQLPPQTRDLILSIGERLSVLLVAGALAERGVPSEPVDASEILVTDSNHGSAEPCMNSTRERCDARLRPLMRRSVVPVITGFIGATEGGAVTTLGRGSSDYSATILSAALDAQEVVIWTDVDGVLTADPRIVPAARTIPEMSYHEAAELANFGANVMHPKIFCPLREAGIPVWVRNTFAPERRGTKITPTVTGLAGGVKAVTAKNGAALITVGMRDNLAAADIEKRAFAAVAASRAEVLLILQSKSDTDICFAVPSAVAVATAEALRREFSAEMVNKKVERVTVEPNVAIVTLVGQKMRGPSESVGRMFEALARAKVSTSAARRDFSETNFSFVIAQKDVAAALVAAHREFQLDSAKPQVLQAEAS